MREDDWRFLRKARRPDFTGFRPIRVVDLFSGCGGMTLGVAEACRASGRGMTVVLAMEKDPRIRRIFDTNFSSILTTRRGDVRERFDGVIGERVTRNERNTKKEVGRVDLILGGPPCQGHSNLNNHTRGRDPKNQLYLSMVRAAEVLQPKHLLIENVPGVRRDSGEVLQRAIRALEGYGYYVDEDLVPGVHVGVPQLRVRHLLIASRTRRFRISDVIDRNRVARPRTVRWAIADLIQPNGDPMSVAPRLSPENLRRARFLLRTNSFDLPNRLRPPCHRNNAQHRYKSMYGRMKWGQPAQTITTGFGSPGQGRYLHPSKLRALTAREAARLQFFPDWFDFSEAPQRTLVAECIGNAVPPKLSFVLGRELLFG